MDADAKSHPQILGLGFGGVANLALEVQRAFNRFHGATELGQETVAGVLDDAAAMVGDGWPDHAAHEAHEVGMGRFFVGVH